MHASGMKHSLQNKKARYLYLEPYTFTVVSGNDVLLYNSLNGKTLEYRASPFISEIITKAEDAGEGFMACIDHVTANSEMSSLITSIKDSFSGDVISFPPDRKPVVVRPKPVIKNYPPPKDFASFSADDYLRNIYFFLNQDNDRLCSDYRFAANQFFCPVYDQGGYREIEFNWIVKSCLPYSGVSGLAIDLSGSDITHYSQAFEMLVHLHKLSLPLTFHIPLPCHDPELIFKFLKTGKSRVSFYVTFPDGPDAISEIRKHKEFIKKSGKIETNFIIRSLEEYQIITGLSNGPGQEKTFILPYFNGENECFFKENVFLARNDIINLKPDQQQIYSRSLINEQFYGKIFIKTDGAALPNLNHDPIGNLNEDSISDLVRQELFKGISWGLTRMKVKPCEGCLYQIFCPPIGNYELFMKRFNFCDVL